jgi:hypothetical protein
MTGGFDSCFLVGNQNSKIENQKSFFAESKKTLWLDIEKRCADCAAAKVENYF